MGLSTTYRLLDLSSPNKYIDSKSDYYHDKVYCTLGDPTVAGRLKEQPIADKV